MPPLALHTAVVRRIAQQLHHRALDADPGSLYLGSTAPDIRILTRWERERTHFFDLFRFDEQSGVAAMFEAYPSLACPASLNPATVAFVSGYISHLVMDEIWINEVYRPFFGQHSPLGGDLKANIMDRAIQYELDRQTRSDREAVEHIVRELARTALNVEVEFIDKDTIGRWRELSMEAVNHPPDWERFHYIAGRALRAAGVDSPEALAEFMKTLPDLLTETTNYLTRERIQAFLEKSVCRGLEALKEYLD
ncbi:MAG: hypothetical protein Q8P22_14305 [Chloroflexota bacterium]|nr:hypothetical protein [Chloroflexota bacterium]